MRPHDRLDGIAQGAVGLGLVPAWQSDQGAAPRSRISITRQGGFKVIREGGAGGGKELEAGSSATHETRPQAPAGRVGPLCCFAKARLRS